MLLLVAGGLLYINEGGVVMLPGGEVTLVLPALPPPVLHCSS